MITSTKHGSYGKLFHLSHPNTDFHRVFRNNMDNGSYVGGVKKIIKSAFTNPNTAFFESVDSLEFSEEYQKCQVL